MERNLRRMYPQVGYSAKFSELRLLFSGTQITSDITLKITTNEKQELMKQSPSVENVK